MRDRHRTVRIVLNASLSEIRRKSSAEVSKTGIQSDRRAFVSELNPNATAVDPRSRAVLLVRCADRTAILGVINLDRRGCSKEQTAVAEVRIGAKEAIWLRDFRRQSQRGDRVVRVDIDQHA